MNDHTKYSEHKAFYRGDLVRVRMTPEIVGQVIAERDWGKSYGVRLGGSTDTEWFEDVEIEPYKAKGKANGGHDDEPEMGLPPHLDNIINLRTVGRA
jgi:hypothetical protein